MAGQGFKDFSVGEVLTSADVDGYLMQQAVMRFADSAARGSALGTATGTGVPLAEGMVSYLDNTNSIEVFNGTAWAGIGGFNAGTAITATDASWSVPTLADPVVRVTVVGGGGGGGGGDNSGATDGAAGGTSTFACSAGTATATGGFGGTRSVASNINGADGKDGFASGNGGEGAQHSSGTYSGRAGGGGGVTVSYFDLTGVTTASVTVGGGGANGTGGANGGDGGDGVVIVEYRAG